MIAFEREQFIIILMIAKQLIYNESSQFLIDPQDNLKHKMAVFQDYYILSFSEGNLHSLLFAISVFGEIRMLTDGATRRSISGYF